MCLEWKVKSKFIVDLLSHAFSDVRIPGVLKIAKK